MDCIAATYAQGFAFLAGAFARPWPPNEETVLIALSGRGNVTIEQILAHYDQSEAALPVAVAALLELPSSSTYAAGVAKIRRQQAEERRRQEETARCFTEADSPSRSEIQSAHSTDGDRGEGAEQLDLTGQDVQPRISSFVTQRSELVPYATVYPDYIPDQEDLESLAWHYLEAAIGAATFSFSTGNCEYKQELFNLSRFHTISTVLGEGKRREIIEKYDEYRRDRDDTGFWQLFKYSDPDFWATPADMDAVRRFAASIPSDEAMTEPERGLYGAHFIEVVRSVQRGEVTLGEWKEVGF
jgi:hypothetical protein